MKNILILLIPSLIISGCSVTLQRDTSYYDAAYEKCVDEIPDDPGAITEDEYYIALDDCKALASYDEHTRYDKGKS